MLEANHNYLCRCVDEVVIIILINTFRDPLNPNIIHQSFYFFFVSFSKYKSYLNRIHARRMSFLNTSEMVTNYYVVSGVIFMI